MIKQPYWHKPKLKEELPDMKLKGCASPHSRLTFPVLLKVAPKSAFLCAEVIEVSNTLVNISKNINLTDALKK